MMLTKVGVVSLMIYFNLFCPIRYNKNSTASKHHAVHARSGHGVIMYNTCSYTVLHCEHQFNYFANEECFSIFIAPVN